ncbi:nucleotidyltransferase family protein [Psychrobacter sp. ANT_WB68]|uniref:nucleotidyltransferase family protein n=1 Tax=Psychrobacter sp. ANT_WB68 TaxID=2597355 RepID=UPI0011F11CC6|nr:nucleotidyltransferase family protein [Psychrobacter sp. ANT_WB68]KAA0914539.1 nucleotidyltransferase family protein [Psychrobacter sp. ANT_WB68]
MTSDVDTHNSILPTKTPLFSSIENNEKNHAVIILASGLSERLGQPKQLLSKHGEPLIFYMTKIALATNPIAVIVVIPQDQPAIADAISGLVRQNTIIYSVVNLIPKTGMAHSLSLGIDALINLEISLINRVLIMGVDQVLLDNEHLTELLVAKSTVVASSYQCLDKASSTDTSKSNIVGLPIVINVECLKQWQPALIGDKGLRHLIRALPPNHLSTIINHQLSYDIDTPKQLFYARQQHWLDA